MEIRAYIQQLREEQGLSIRTLAERSGVRRQSIQVFLKGANIHLDNLQKLLAALGHQLTVGPLAEVAQSLAQTRLSVKRKHLSSLCRKYGIKRLSLFGSILRPDYSPKSDIDILVEFKKPVSFVQLAAVEEALAILFPQGRHLDVVTEQSLSPYFRDEVMAAREILYEEAA